MPSGQDAASWPGHRRGPASVLRRVALVTAGQQPTVELAGYGRGLRQAGQVDVRHVSLHRAARRIVDELAGVRSPASLQRRLGSARHLLGGASGRMSWAGVRPIAARVVIVRAAILANMSAIIANVRGAMLYQSAEKHWSVVTHDRLLAARPRESCARALASASRTIRSAATVRSAPNRNERRQPDVPKVATRSSSRSRSHTTQPRERSQPTVARVSFSGVTVASPVSAAAAAARRSRPTSWSRCDHDAGQPTTLTGCGQQPAQAHRPSLCQTARVVGLVDHGQVTGLTRWEH